MQRSLQELGLDARIASFSNFDPIIFLNIKNHFQK